MRDSVRWLFTTRELKQLPVQPQLSESTDRSRLVWWRDVANGEMVDNKL
jgi:hypothetical protein